MSKRISLTLIAGICAAFMVPSFALAAVDDYVHFYPFDEGMGRSVGDFGTATHQNGIMVGTSTGFGWASGKAGNALGMDGAAGTGVVLPDGTLSGSEGTLSLWFKMNNMTDRNVLFSARSTTDRNIYMYLSLDLEGRPTLTWRDNGTASDRRAQVSRPLNKNEWYHLIFVATGSGYRAVVNGEEFSVTGENIGRWFPSFTFHTLTYRIGGLDSNTLQASFDGYIDDVRIYERALSTGEAVNLYETTNAAVPTIPLGTPPSATTTAPLQDIPAVEVVLDTIPDTTMVTTQTVLTTAERAAKIAEIKSLLVSLYTQVIEILKVELAAKQNAQ